MQNIEQNRVGDLLASQAFELQTSRPNFGQAEQPTPAEEVLICRYLDLAQQLPGPRGKIIIDLAAEPKVAPIYWQTVLVQLLLPDVSTIVKGGVTITPYSSELDRRLSMHSVMGDLAGRLKTIDNHLIDEFERHNVGNKEEPRENYFRELPTERADFAAQVTLEILEYILAASEPELSQLRIHSWGPHNLDHHAHLYRKVLVDLLPLLSEPIAERAFKALPATYSREVEGYVRNEKRVVDCLGYLSEICTDPQMPERWKVRALEAARDAMRTESSGSSIASALAKYGYARTIGFIASAELSYPKGIFDQDLLLIATCPELSVGVPTSTLPKILATVKANAVAEEFLSAYFGQYGETGWIAPNELPPLMAFVEANSPAHVMMSELLQRVDGDNAQDRLAWAAFCRETQDALVGLREAMKSRHAAMELTV